MKKLTAIGIIAATLSLGACSTTPVNMAYNPARVAARDVLASPTISIVSAADHRKHDRNWLGAIRGGFGNPLKTLETPVPVSEVVKIAFTDGLKARGMLSSSEAPFSIDLNVIQFDCNQYIRREAHIKVDVSIIDRASGANIYQKAVNKDIIEGSLMAMDVGLFASTDDLRAIANRALQEAVDQALDDPALIAAIKNKSAQ